MKEQNREDIDGRTIWNNLERTTNELKDRSLTNGSEILQYNLTLKPIYLEMSELIKKFGMDKSEFNPKSNFEIKLNKIMQIGFNAGQLSVFIETNKRPSNQTDITNFIMQNNMLDLDTYVNSKTQEIINSKYLSSFQGGKRSYHKKKKTSKVFRFNKFCNVKC